MVTVIKRTPSIGAQLGAGIGQGLAESIPKEIDRYRLSAGLKKFQEQAANLTPMQQLAQLSSIPGITPQMIQSFGELAKQQSMRNAYQRKAGGAPQRTQSGVTPQDVEFMGGQGKPKAMGTEPQPEPEFGRPQVVQKNPLAEEMETAIPWTPQERDERISRKLEDFPHMTIPEAMASVAEDEQRYLQAPKAHQEEYQRVQGLQRDAIQQLDQALSLKLEKNPPIAGPGGTSLPNPEVYKNISGEEIARLRRGMESDLRMNKKATVQDVVDKWSNKALDLSKAKSGLTAMKGAGITTILPEQKKENLRKLQSYQKIFADIGNLEQYYNLLQEDFGMSPQGAAWVAYPRSEKVKSVVDSYKRSTLSNYSENSRKIAKDLLNNMNSNDSVLAIAKDLKRKDNLFDEYAFFDELNQNFNSLNKRQQREVGEGASSFIPSWGDLWILPAYLPPMFQGE